MWLVASAGQHLRAAIAKDPVEFNKFLTGWGTLSKLVVATFSGLSFELSLTYSVLDAAAQNIVQYYFDPQNRRFAALQLSIVNTAVAIAASYVLSLLAREMFLLRLRLYVQQLRGTNAAIAQHGLLDAAPAAMALVKPGYATVRSSPASGADGESNQAGLRVDLHSPPSVSMMTQGANRVLDHIEAQFHKHGLHFISLRSGKRRLGSSRDGVASSQAPMLEHTGKDLIRMLGVCKQDRPLAYWALFCAPDRQDDDLLTASHEASKSLASHSIHLIQRLKHSAGLSTSMQTHHEQPVQPNIDHGTNDSHGNSSGLHKLAGILAGSSSSDTGHAGSSDSRSRGHTLHAAEDTSSGPQLAGHPAEEISRLFREARDAPSTRDAFPGEAHGVRQMTSITATTTRKRGHAGRASSSTIPTSDPAAVPVSVVDWSSDPKESKSPRQNASSVPAASRSDGALRTGRVSQRSLQSWCCLWRQQDCCCGTAEPSKGSSSCFCCPCVEQSDVVVEELAAKMSALFVMSRAAAGVGATLELEPLDQVRAAVEPWSHANSLLHATRPIQLNRASVGTSETYSFNSSPSQRPAPLPALRRYGDRLARRDQAITRQHLPGVPSAALTDQQEVTARDGMRKRPFSSPSGEATRGSSSRSSSVIGSAGHSGLLAVAGGNQLVASGSNPADFTSLSTVNKQSGDGMESAGVSSIGLVRRGLSTRPGTFETGQLRDSIEMQPVKTSSNRDHSHDQAEQVEYEPQRVGQAAPRASGVPRLGDRDMESQENAGAAQSSREENDQDSPLDVDTTEAASVDSAEVVIDTSTHPVQLASAGKSSRTSQSMGPQRPDAREQRERAHSRLAPAASVASRMRLVHSPGWINAALGRGLLSPAVPVGSSGQRGPASTRRRHPSPVPLRLGKGQSVSIHQRQRLADSLDSYESSDSDGIDATAVSRTPALQHGAGDDTEIEMGRNTVEVVEVRRQFRGLVSQLHPAGASASVLEDAGASVPGASGESITRSNLRGGIDDELQGSAMMGGLVHPKFGWPILRSTPDERHVVLRVGLGNTVVAEVYLMARRHEGGVVTSLAVI